MFRITYFLDVKINKVTVQDKITKARNEIVSLNQTKQ